MVKKIINKYKGMSQQLRVVFWFTFVGFLQKGISVITTPIFTRVLSTEDYGLFSVFNAYYTTLAIVATLSLHMGAINNAFVKRNEPHEKIISSFQSLSLVISFLVFIFALVFRTQLSQLMSLPTIVVIFLFLGFVFKEPYLQWVIYKRYQFDYVVPVIVSIIISIFTPLFSVIAIFITSGNQGVARILSYVIINTIIPGIIFYVINYKKGKSFYNKSLWTYALSFNTPLLMHYLSETLLNQTDRIMINAFWGSGEAGIYSVAFSVAYLVSILVSSLNTAYIPWTYQKLKEGNIKKLEKVSYIILIMLTGILSVMIMFAPEVIAILAGSKYTQAVYLVPTLAASVFFGFMYQLFGRIELFYERKSYTAIGTFLAAVMNIILNIWWIPEFGYTAAGYSTLISHIMLCVMHFYFLRRVNKECMNGQKVYDGHIITLISIVILVIAFIMTLLYRYIFLRVMLLTVIAIISFLMRNRIIEAIKELQSK